MYYCNKCGQEMADSGHRCAVQSERLTSFVRSNATTGWISVKDRLPEDGQVVAFIIDKSVNYYGGSMCAGRCGVISYNAIAYAKSAGGKYEILELL